jgi:hypothetical protein
MPKKNKGPTPRNHHLKMALIPEGTDLSEWAVMERAEDSPDDAPIVNSVGGHVLLDCGACGRNLIRAFSTHQIQGGAWNCPDCGRYNTTL